MNRPIDMAQTQRGLTEACGAETPYPSPKVACVVHCVPNVGHSGCVLRCQARLSRDPLLTRSTESLCDQASKGVESILVVIDSTPS